MVDDDWLKELEMLALKFSQLGMNPDLATMTLAELWGVYCRLRTMG
jgi:hypothetical protein